MAGRSSCRPGDPTVSAIQRSRVHDDQDSLRHGIYRTSLGLLDCPDLSPTTTLPLRALATLPSPSSIQAMGRTRLVESQQSRVARVCLGRLGALLHPCRRRDCSARHVPGSRLFVDKILWSDGEFRSRSFGGCDRSPDAWREGCSAGEESRGLGRLGQGVGSDFCQGYPSETVQADDTWTHFYYGSGHCRDGHGGAGSG